ncbi:MAG TPA: thiamine pyrophosphate-binding protein [Gammaproteobacteria bacterium]|nr:thiamine pyrophosphate-binding protein [Gammaproteobacteria bacterium]HIM06695.1 thiamine pyrophosphate-binding protein [Gammaproteobacteria bacterium]
MTRMSPWRMIVEALKAEGIDRLFGLPGNPIHLVDDLHRHSNIQNVLVRHEHSGVSLAYAYARVTGRPAVCYGNPGPGITNMATALLEAHSASLPVIALSNGTPISSDGKGAFQELDSVSFMRPVTKWATRIVSPETTPWVMQRAFSIAKNGRPGPVFIDVPSDIALQSCSMPPYKRSLDRHTFRPDSDAIAAAAALVKKAKQPIIICGSGAVSSRAGTNITRLAESIGAALYTTPGGRGTYAEDHPLCLGQIGLYFTDAGKKYFDESDLVISFGSRLEDFSTGGWTLWPSRAKFIQIDIDPESIGLNIRPHTALVGDAELTAIDLLTAIDNLSVKNSVSRFRVVNKLQTRYIANIQRQLKRQTKPISGRQVVGAINRVFGKDTIMVHENGGADLWSYYWPYYQVLDAGDCIPMGEQTAMGMGVIGAIAAKMAAPNKNVVCVAGDGAMQMAMMELTTAAENKCGITWVVLNNAALGWPQYIQVLEKQAKIATNFESSPEFAKMARSQNCKGIRVTEPDKVEPALRSALRANRSGIPVLVEVQIAKHDYAPHFQHFHREVWGLGQK